MTDIEFFDKGFVLNRPGLDCFSTVFYDRITSMKTVMAETVEACFEQSNRFRNDEPVRVLIKFKDEGFFHVPLSDLTAVNNIRNSYINFLEDKGGHLLVYGLGRNKALSSSKDRAADVNTDFISVIPWREVSYIVTRPQIRKKDRFDICIFTNDKDCIILYGGKEDLLAVKEAQLKYLTNKQNL